MEPDSTDKQQGSFLLQTPYPRCCLSPLGWGSLCLAGWGEILLNHTCKVQVLASAVGWMDERTGVSSLHPG